MCKFYPKNNCGELGPQSTVRLLVPQSSSNRLISSSPFPNYPPRTSHHSPPVPGLHYAITPLPPTPMSTLSPLTPSLPLHPQTQNPQTTPQSISSRFQLSAFTPTLRSPTLPKLPLSPHEIPKLPSTQSLFDQKLHLLHSHGVDFSPSDLRRIADMCPELLPASPCLLSSAITFLLSDVGLSPSNLPPLFRRRPRLLLSPVKTRLRPALFFLLSLDLTPVKDYASFLCFSVEDKFLPRLDFLQELGFSHKEARSIVRRFPLVFNYSIEKNMKPKTQFLLKDMGRGNAPSLVHLSFFGHVAIYC